MLLFFFLLFFFQICAKDCNQIKLLVWVYSQLYFWVWKYTVTVITEKIMDFNIYEVANMLLNLLSSDASTQPTDSNEIWYSVVSGSCWATERKSIIFIATLSQAVCTVWRRSCRNTNSTSLSEEWLNHTVPITDPTKNTIHINLQCLRQSGTKGTYNLGVYLLFVMLKPAMGLFFSCST